MRQSQPQVPAVTAMSRVANVASDSIHSRPAGHTDQLYRTRSPMTRLTPSRRRQRHQHVADACGLALNDKHLIHRRVEYNAS